MYPRFRTLYKQDAIATCTQVITNITARAVMYYFWYCKIALAVDLYIVVKCMVRASFIHNLNS